MAAVTNATPLLSLDAVAIDTETTGLNPRKCRLVEIGAVRLSAGRLDESDTVRVLVNPGEAIPAEATRIHNIDASAVEHAPEFPAAWRQFRAFAGDAVLIGHSIGFDLAVLRRECERAGLPWLMPRTLDTQHLAQVVEPQLPGHSLEELAAWLGLQLAERHSALGDAISAARIFQALIPKLRDRGIRTFAEAANACRRETGLLEQQHRAGWMTPDAQARESFRFEGTFDTYPYSRRVSEVMSAPPLIIRSDRPLKDALADLMERRVSSVFVAPANSSDDKLPAARAGILTERDILRALAEEGEAALARAVEQFMSKPLAVIPGEAFVYRAVGRMSRLKIRHLGVIDESGLLIGALSARDLLRLRAQSAVSLGDEIDQAGDVHALGRAWAKLPAVAASLLAEGVPAIEVAAIISRELGALTRQAAVLGEQRMRDAGLGEAPCPYAVAVLGSAGRGESLLAMDQDNALIFERGEPGGADDRWFERLGTHIADLLNEVGVPHCKGGVMARNAQWRGSVATWQQRVSDWITRSRPQDLLAVDIFFDLRGVHGELALADSIWRQAYDAAKEQPAFAKLLAEVAGRVEPGLGIFGGFRTSGGRIDLKRAGLFGIVSVARALSIRHHVLRRATPDRLRGVQALKLGAEADIDALLSAQSVLLDLILAQQLRDIDAGTSASNAVVVKTLSPKARERLRTALQSVRHLDELTRELLF